MTFEQKSNKKNIFVLFMIMKQENNNSFKASALQNCEWKNFAHHLDNFGKREK